MRVVTDRKTKMTLDFASRDVYAVFARSKHLDDGQGHVGVVCRIYCTPLLHELIQSNHVGSFGEPLAKACCKRNDSIPTLRGLQDATNGREATRLHETSRHAVRCDHLVFHQ